MKSIRLPNRNYAANGYYFVTICTNKRECFFGDVIDGKMELSDVGKIAQQYWSEIPQHSKYTYLDEYIIMPNHIHGIIIIDNPNNPSREIPQKCRDVPWYVPTLDDLYKKMSELSPKSGTLSVIIRSYKAAVTRWCRQNDCNYFAWQPRFYEHIIRNDGSLGSIREYIVNNPAKWTEDRDHIQ